MSGQSSARARDLRDEIAKSTLTGVGVAALAAAFSSAGFGGLIGTSQASGAGPLPAPEEDAYVSLPAYPQPLTSEEIDTIRAQLSTTIASLEITKAATDERIERVRALAATDGLVTVAMSQAPNHQIDLTASGELRPRMSEAALAAPETTSAAVQTNAQYDGSGGMERDSHLEFAALLFGEDDQYY